ncbi:MAG: hypothetical protein AB2A00_38420 [Myxococcota bacterium]
MSKVLRTTALLGAGATHSACFPQTPPQGSCGGYEVAVPEERAEDVQDRFYVADGGAYFVDGGQAQYFHEEPCNYLCTGEVDAGYHLHECSAAPRPDGGVTLTCRVRSHGGCGRYTQGVDDWKAPVSDPVAAYLAGAARLEAVAVLAFRRLEGELRSLGAPTSLLTRLERATSEEERHAELMRQTTAHPVPAPSLAAWSPRSLWEVATENFVEGCLAETVGAAMMQHQATHATDTPWRRTFSIIAPDEERHAQLSWDVASWAVTRISADAARAWARDMEAAAAHFSSTQLEETHSELTLRLGVPTRTWQRVARAHVARVARDWLSLLGITRKLAG